MELTHKQRELMRQWSKDEQAFERLVELFERQAQQVDEEVFTPAQAPVPAKVSGTTDLYRVLVNHLPNTAIFLFDKDMRFIFAEGDLRRQSGLDEADFVGKPLRNFFAPEAYKRYEARLRAVFAGNASSGDVTHNGRIYFVQVFPVYREDGTVEAGMVLSQDITERKLMEIALRDNQARFRNAFEHSPIGIALVQLDTRWMRVNREVEKITGFTESELIEMSYHDMTPAEDRARDAEVIEQLIRGDIKISQVEKRFVRKDGGVIWVLCSASVVRDADGTPINFVLQIISIEQQKQMVAELERTNQDLKAFAEIVSHDLKAPLYAMSSLMQQLRLNASYRLTTDESEIIDLILEEVRGMDSLIEGVLSYSRLSFDSDEMVRVDFNELVAHIVRIIAPQPHIRVRIANSLPTLTVDKTKMSQVFLNLLSNAVKYNDKASGVVNIRCVPAGAGWLFSVADNGRGVEAQDFPLIFQMFKRGKTTPRGRSSGMGLPFVKKIIESYGGQVWFTSETGVGSVFYFRLPIVD